MKFSERWLRQWVDPPLSSGQLAEQLTMAGLEVESTVSLKPDWGRVVAGLVESVTPHPASAELKICAVNTGSGSASQVVCGAPGVAAGKLYAMALPGARTADGRVLEAASIRGVLSEGMLCSRAELGLGEESGALLELQAPAKAGMPLEQVLELDDHVFDLAVTANRGDCLSISGIAREVAVLNGLDVRCPEIPAVTATSDRRRSVSLPVPAACPRYLGRVIEDVEISRPTPLWITERLRRADVRGINIVVDITNYVMLELGQPMHAFDNDRLQGEISVRRAEPSEKLKCLDGQERDLAEDVLVIADASGAVALAGIMGGDGTAIGPGSRNIFLESAFFVPEHVRGRARRYGLQTDASHRFERGVDPSLPAQAMERASGLILEYCGGRAGPVTDATSHGHLPKPPALMLRRERLHMLLGVTVAAGQVSRILEHLGFSVRAVADGWEVGVPAHRFDVTLEADLVEEVARIHGYEHIPSRRPDGRPAMHRQGPDPRFSAWRRILAARGYFEAITYSFVDAAQQSGLFGAVPALRLQNPIATDRDAMRISLLPGLLQALHYNVNRQQTRVRLFEIGRVFLARPSLTQDYRIAGISYGNIYPEQWDRNNRLSDFYDLKADVEALLADLRVDGEIDYEAADVVPYQSGRTANIFFNKQRVGTLGALHPKALAGAGIDGPALAFELYAEHLVARSGRHFAHFSRFPSMRRDLALVVGKDIQVAELLAEVRASGGELLTNLELFDVYEGEGVDSGKKSLALGLTFQKSSSTLIDAEVEAALGGILGAVQGKFGATLRK